MEEQFSICPGGGQIRLWKNDARWLREWMACFGPVRAGKMLQLSSPAFSGSERSTMSAAVAMRSVRHTISSLKDPAATFFGPASDKGNAMPAFPVVAFAAAEVIGAVVIVFFFSRVHKAFGTVVAGDDKEGVVGDAGFFRQRP